ncbi:archaea-specific SMC-related protein [Haloarcula onubensis]|uniref:ATPase n=1 Tax=Haloarcula onubensis TaxID=2950539 RepID=A0ABU2FP26_9EURY|nr:archaea-specific SMC-related protein [Halomicroarcula sp. S3CR25-11]MDS0281931.1 ATPase [Halomicroarcula sp. S3CR25-11]
MWELEVSNIAGIRDGEPTVEPGINAVQASNWQGKTSLVTALRTVLGGSVTSSTLTDGVDAGHVRLRTPDEEYERRLRRTGGTVTADGRPYLTDEREQAVAELFAFLDERNRVRTAVREGEDLTPHLVEPLEREDIEGQIARLKAERETVEAELERAQQAAEKLPAKTDTINSLESELAELEAEADDLEGTADESGAQAELRTELTQARREREQASQRVNRLEGKTESLESQIADKERELDALTVSTAPDLPETLAEKQSALRELDGEIETLEALYNATKQVLDQGHLDVVADVERRIDSDHLTCWVCGSDTTRDDIEEQMDGLSDAISDRRERRSELQSTVSELEDRQREIEQQRRRKQSLEDGLDELRTNLADSRDELSDARDELASSSERVETLEARVQETDDRRQSLDQEIARTETKLERHREDRDQLETQAQQREQLQERLDSLSGEIEDLRSRRERVIRTARTAFDEALEDVVDRFNPSFESARLRHHVDPDSGRTEQLELLIARDGREISVDALSEGEVELIGLIAALAGHEAFDVAEQVPCIILDDLGGLASEHIHTLVHYLSARTEYLVTTAYPEAGEFDGHVLSPDDWDVVSDHADQPA